MLQKFEKPFTFDRVVRLTISTLSICGGLYLLYVLKGVLLPFFIAWLMAYILSPVVRFLRRRLRVGNSIAVIMTLAGCAGIIILLGIILTPMIQEEVHQINYLIANYNFKTITADGIAINIQDIINQYIDFKELQDRLSNKSVVEIIQYVSPAVEKIFSNTISLLFGVTVAFIVMLYLIFILLDYEKINNFWKLLIHPKYRPTVSRIALDVERNMNTYFRHQAVICCILATLYSIGFQIIGLPMAIVFGLFVGAIHMIPYLQVVSFPPAILLCWLRASQSNDSFWAMIGFTVLIYIIVQGVHDLVLVPKIMGKAMGLNPAIILLSLSIWGYFLGIVGMIIAIPLTTLLLSYYREFLEDAEKMRADDIEKEGLVVDKEE